MWFRPMFNFLFKGQLEASSLLSQQNFKTFESNIFQRLIL
jgi:hypothetical protein